MANTTHHRTRRMTYLHRCYSIGADRLCEVS
jgi:hypothetical protein